MCENMSNTDLAKNGSDFNGAQIQELNDVKEFLKIQQNKYAKYKILYDALEEYVASSDDVDSELKGKVRDILLSHNCSQVMPLNSKGFSQDSTRLLGISTNASELNYCDSVKLKKSLELILQEKYNNMCKQFTKITDQNIHESSSNSFLEFNLPAEDHVLLEFKKKLSEQQNQYLQNLLKEQEILGDIAKLRLENLPIVCNDKIKECEVKSHINSLKTKITQEKTRVDIFMETNNSLPAYSELMKDIKKQQQECQNDIEHLQKLKDSYSKINCKHFNELLKSYIQYKSSLEKKKLIFNSLK